jgi:Domain of unknown function (DUF4267)
MLGLGLAGLAALALIGIGLGALLAPRFSSRQYGILLEDPRALAFIRAMGVRDGVIGVLLLLLAGAGRRELLAWALLATTAIAGVDFALVWRDRAPAAGPRSTARLLHALGALGLLGSALVIASGH